MTQLLYGNTKIVISVKYMCVSPVVAGTPAWRRRCRARPSEASTPPSAPGSTSPRVPGLVAYICWLYDLYR